MAADNYQLADDCMSQMSDDVPSTLTAHATTSTDDLAQAALDTKASLTANILEAKERAAAGRWTEAAEGFALALDAYNQHDVQDPTLLATLIENMAWSFHALGFLEEAKEHYEQALAYFENVRLQTIAERLGVGADINASRVQFIKERLVEVSFRQPPAPEYLDEYGRRRPMIGQSNDDEAVEAPPVGGSQEQGST